MDLWEQAFIAMWMHDDVVEAVGLWDAGLIRVSGKNSLLFQITEASLDRPDRPVKDVVYPITNEATLWDLVRV